MTRGSNADLKRVVDPMDPRDRRIIELERQLSQSVARHAAADAQRIAADARRAAAEARVAELTLALSSALRRVEELEKRVAALSRNSSNSSKPPSSNPPGSPAGARAKKNKAKRKRRGARMGHKAHQRPLAPAEKVNEFINVIPETCKSCQAALTGEDPVPQRHQVVEIPPIEPTVVEYLLHCLRCPKCRTRTRAELPHGVSRSAFGARLAALLALCTARFRMSKRAVKELFSDVLGVELAMGSVSRIEAQVSTALAVPTAEAGAHVRAAAVVHADETGWREAKRKAWLWVAATPTVAVFLVALSRGTQIARALLGSAFTGILVSDRWAGYHWVDKARRQLCWAHLLRDFQSWVDDGGAASGLGEGLLARARKMFRWWCQVRDGTLPRETFVRRMRAVQLDVGTLLTEASQLSGSRAAGMARQILALEPALWTFVDTPGVEPTNNYAERTVRHAVLLRKSSFGTDSAGGSRFVERMLTTTATLRLQGRNVLDFLEEAVKATREGRAAPNLLPADSVRQAAAA